MDESAKSSATSKAISVLEALASVGRPITATEIGLIVGQNRQTVHRVLTHLEELSLVQRDVNVERYRLGTRFGNLAVTGLSTLAHHSEAHRILLELVGDVRETSNIGALQGFEVIYLDRVECDWPLRMHLKVGSRVDAYCTAIGKLLLASLPDERLQDYFAQVSLTRLTPNTITTPKRLTAELARIREQGFSVNNQEDHVGLLAVAVPLYASNGNVAAGLALHGPDARLPLRRALNIVPRLNQAASELSRILFNAETRKGGKRSSITHRK